ncbi:MAG: hypothetical protein ABH833_03655 [Parcubacteria group bacterium]
MINERQIQEMQQMIDNISVIIDSNINNKSIQDDAQRLLKCMEEILDDKQKPLIVDNENNLRWQVGSQRCGICKTDKDIIQFERDTKRKGLPIKEIAFICKSCAKKEGLLTDSNQVTCDICGKVAQTYDYFSKKVCSDCINAEEHGEKANN